MKWGFLSLSVALTVLGLAGCAATQSEPAAMPTRPDNMQVAKRAAERWQFLLAGKLDDAYSFLSPGKRSLLPLDQYRGEIKTGMWRNAKVESVDCVASDICKVTVLVSYEYRGKLKEPIENTRPLNEIWRYQHGDWWFVQTE